MLQGTTGPTRNTTIPNADSALLKFSKFEELPQTQTQIEEQNVRKGILDKTKEFFGGKSDRATEAYDTAGVSDARTALTEINVKMAERRKQLRNDLQSLEKDASERGVAREFAVDRRNQINSEAYFELANDALIATALQGNYDMAKDDAKTLIDEQYSEYDAYIKQQQAELDYMKPQLTADQKKQADVYQFQLDQMKEQLAQKKDDETNVKKLAIEIAGQGAPSDVYTSMLNNPDLTYAEAIQIAAPYIGLLDRRNTNSLIAERGKESTSGGFTSGGFSASAAQIGEVTRALDTERGSDNYTNTQVYLNFLKQATDGGALPQDFLKKFPPDLYLNPDDPSIPAYIKQDMQKVDLFNMI